MFCSVLIRLAKTFKDQLESAKSGDVKHDLIWWAENYGADMPKNWPRFEVCASLEITASFFILLQDLSKWSYNLR